jgi:hypothetical protein
METKEKDKRLEENSVEINDLVLTDSQGRKLILILSYLLLIGLLVSSVNTYRDGSHNVDLAWNMRYIENQYGRVLIDLGTDGNYRTSEDLYLLGMEQIRKGIGTGITTFLLFVFVLYAHKETEKEERLK